jgi:hypothetical protein
MCCSACHDHATDKWQLCNFRHDGQRHDAPGTDGAQPVRSNPLNNGNRTTSEPVILLPKLGEQFDRMPFATWWESDSVANDKGVSVSRRRIVLGAANKDGGAHVDPKLERFYENLANGKYAIGITGDLTYDGDPPFEQGVTHYPSNGHLALLRQFAHEVLQTAEHFGWVSSVVPKGGPHPSG